MKSRKFLYTIQFKLIFIIGGIFLVVVSTIIIIDMYLYQKELVQTLTRDATYLSVSIQSSLEMAMLTGKREQIQQSLERISDDEHIGGLFLTNKTGMIKIASDPDLIGRTLDPITFSSLSLDADLLNDRHSILQNLGGTRLLRTVRPIRNKKICHSCHDSNDLINGMLYLDYPLTTYDKQAADYKFKTAVLIGLGTLLLAGFIFLLLNKLIVNRVKFLVSRIQSISSGDFQKNFDTYGKDEFAFLDRSISEMSDHIKRSIVKISTDRDYFQNLVNSVQDGLLVVDKSHNVVLVNKAFLRLIHRESEDVVGHPCFKTMGEQICGSRHGHQSCPSAEVFKTGCFAHNIYKYRDGKKQRIFEISASPLFDEKEQLIQSIEIVRDITEKKKLEDELLQSEKMALVGRLAAGVAHEINNPLATISTCTEGLLDRLTVKTGSEKVLVEYLLRIEKNVFRCKHIIEQILAFSHTTNTPKTTCDLNEIIIETIQMASHQLAKTQKQVKALPFSSPALINGDANQISQLILNLIMNSLDALVEGGQVTLSIFSNHNRVILMIEDNGCGIEDRDIDSIFDPFFTTKEVGKGTGLGLSICKKIVDDHGGRIKVESTKGKGSKFVIDFPKL